MKKFVPCSRCELCDLKEVEDCIKRQIISREETLQSLGDDASAEWVRPINNALTVLRKALKVFKR